MYGLKWPFLLILIVYGPSVVVVNCWDRFCTLGRAPRTNETLPDFHERCYVTRQSREFRGLTGCQRTLGFWGVTAWLEGLGLTPWSFRYKDITALYSSMLGFRYVIT